MATIGQVLKAPEAGWQRIDDTNININYSGLFTSYSDPTYYNGSTRCASDPLASINFNFIGTKFRIIGTVYKAAASATPIYVDGVQVGTMNQCGAIEVEPALNFEYTGLTNTNHHVKIGPAPSGYLYFDAIDIDSTGEIKPYSPIVPPTSLTAKAGNSKVILSWNAVTGATGYNVKRSTTAGGPYTTVGANVSTTSYVDTAITNGTTYYYVVTAVNSAAESAKSNEASATPIAAPTNLTAAAGDSQVTLSWTSVTGATNYSVKRSTTAGGPYTTIANNVIGTSYIDNSVTNGTMYYYVVAALNSTAESANSNEVFATPIVSAPINLAAISGNSQVDLSWEGVKTASGYNVKRSITAGGPYTVIAGNVSTNSYVDSAVNNGTTYYYVVTALSGNSESVNSNEASATPQGHGLLRITMNDSSEREYQLSDDEINKFIEWCDRAVGTGKTLYIFDKTYNVGEFKNRKDYLLFDKIISFEVMELTK